MGTLGHEAEVWEDIAVRCEDIGGGIVIRYVSNRKRPRAGVILYHRHKDGKVCGGFVQFRVAGCNPSKPSWKVESWDPLTLSPSIEDKKCGEHLHGHIVNGRWVKSNG